MSETHEIAEFLGGPKDGERLQVHRDDMTVRFYCGDVLTRTVTGHVDYRRDPQAPSPTFVLVPEGPC